MADFTNSRNANFGSSIPEGTIESPFVRFEPLITPEQIKGRFLFGVPLVSLFPNPITKQVQVLTDDILKDLVVGAVNSLEQELGIDIFASQKKERHGFDPQEFNSYGYFRLRHRPISSVQRLSIESNDGTSFFDFPLDWLEMGNLHTGQLNILPLSVNTALTGLGPVGGGPSGAFIYTFILSQMGGNIPAYYTATYTTGFPDDSFPRVINDLIGIETAINVLGMLGATYLRNSASLSIDALSQSTSTPGNNQYTARLTQLQAQKAKMAKRIKVIVGLSLFVGTV